MNIIHKVQSNHIYKKLLLLMDHEGKNDQEIEKDCYKAFSLIERLDPNTAKQILLWLPFHQLPKKNY